MKNFFTNKFSRIILPLSISLILLIIMHIPIASHASIQFVDVTEPSGIINNGNSWGASWGDFNSDGFPDLWLTLSNN